MTQHSTLERPLIPAAARVPRPTLRNPFKAGGDQARQFDGMLKAYEDKHRDVVRENGTVRCMGNNLATHFWRGYDGSDPRLIERQSLAWACYRAGQAQRLLDNARGVYLPPKTNSGVPVR